MSNSDLKTTGGGELSTANSEEVMSALRNSLYPGAKDESIAMVLSYCRAAGLDPMQKPVHIVPMYVKGQDGGSMRDIVMPGIGLYRIQAARSGDYAGMDEPEFGPAVSQTFELVEKKYGSNKEVKSRVDTVFPEWCKITVRKIVQGITVAFSSKEYWIENYATKNKKSTAPNSMWLRRPFGQLAKCAEAQALRKGWPEIGAQATAEEMEGKVIEMGDIPAQPKAEKQLPPTLDEVLKAINAANDLIALNKTAGLAARIEKEDEKKQARAAFSNRRDVLSKKKEPEAVDAEVVEDQAAA